MAHAQKPDLVFQRNGRVHLDRRGCQFSRLLAAEECGSADSNCIDRVPTYSGRLLATHSIRIFPLHFPSRASPCAIRFRTRYTRQKQPRHDANQHQTFQKHQSLANHVVPVDHYNLNHNATIRSHVKSGVNVADELNL